jgi:excisionase family DNA binding protein
VTVKQMAERLECSLKTAYNLVNAGKIEHRSIGPGRGRIDIPPRALAAFLASRRVEVSSPPRGLDRGPTPP